MTDFSTLQSSEAILIDLDRVVHYTMNILYRKHFFLPKIQRICLSQLREHVAQSKLFSLSYIYIWYLSFILSFKRTAEKLGFIRHMSMKQTSCINCGQWSYIHLKVSVWILQTSLQASQIAFHRGRFFLSVSSLPFVSIRWYWHYDRYQKGNTYANWDGDDSKIRGVIQ